MTTKPSWGPDPEAVSYGGPWKQAEKGEFEGTRPGAAGRAAGHRAHMARAAWTDGSLPGDSRRPQLRIAARPWTPCYPWNRGYRGGIKDWASMSCCPLEFQRETPRHQPRRKVAPGELGPHPAGRNEWLQEATLAGIPETVPACSSTHVWLPSPCPQ